MDINATDTGKLYEAGNEPGGQPPNTSTDDEDSEGPGPGPAKV